MEVLFGDLEEYGTVVYVAKDKLYVIGESETFVYDDTPENREKYVNEAMEYVKSWLF